jgi:hypothetical protein
VPDHASLRLTGSFTFTAWIAPTSQRVGPPDQRVGAEGLLTKWQAGANPLGYAIGVDDGGRLALWLADGAGGVEALRADVALRPWIPAIPGPNQRPQGVATSWYFVAVSFDGGTGRVVLTQDPQNDFPFDATRATATPADTGASDSSGTWTSTRSGVRSPVRAPSMTPMNR